MAGLAAIFTTSAAATTLLAGHWGAVTGAAGVIVLGSGSALSVLIRTGRARLLIAAGDDPDAFDRAWASVARPTAPRLDILLSAGSGAAAAVPEHVLRRRRPGTALAIVPPGVAARESALAGEGVTTLRHSIRITLPGAVSVDVEPPVIPGDDRWHVVVGHGGSRVVIVPSLREMGQGTDRGGVSATVVLTGPRDEVAVVPGTGSLVVAATPRGTCPFEGARPVTDDDPAGDHDARLAWVIGEGDAIGARFESGRVAFERRGAWHLPSSPP